METLHFLLYFAVNLNLVLNKIKFINKKSERKKSRNTGEEYCKQRKQQRAKGPT